MNASAEALGAALRDEPAVAHALVACRQLNRIATLEELASARVELGDPRLRDYLVAELQNPSEERLHAIFLDRDNRYIRDERMSQGSGGNLVLRLRFLVHRALDLGAVGLIVAHNHPSGCAAPSAADHDATDRLRILAAQLDIRLVDHCIVARGQVFSMALGDLF
jgi:DNA repair protein RadC